MWVMWVGCLYSRIITIMCCCSSVTEKTTMFGGILLVLRYLNTLDKYVKTADNIYTWRDEGEQLVFQIVTILCYSLPFILKDLKFILCKSQDTIQAFKQKSKQRQQVPSASKTESGKKR